MVSQVRGAEGQKEGCGNGWGGRSFMLTGDNNNWTIQKSMVNPWSFSHGPDVQC